MNQQLLSKINELEELIELAEKVSINIDSINDKLEKLQQHAILLFFTSIFFIAAIFKFQEIQDIGFWNKYDYLFSILFSIGLLALVAISLRLLYSATNMRESIKNENLILKDLLNMIHSYKQVVYNNEISVVKKAIIDMRLSRIKFNKKDANKKEKKGFVKKEKVAPV